MGYSNNFLEKWSNAYEDKKTPHFDAWSINFPNKHIYTLAIVQV